MLARRIILLATAVLLTYGGVVAPAVFAQGPATVQMFVREECRHCEEAKDFLVELSQEMPGLETRYYDLAEGENSRLFEQITGTYGIQKGTPITLIGRKLMVGFDQPETTGKLWQELIEQGGDTLTFAQIARGGAEVMSSIASVCTESQPCTESSLAVTIPWTNRVVDVGGWSLISLSAVLGLIDGFNPCAMWVLVMLIVMLSQVGNKKRMWQYAGLFILAQAIMYYLILTVWLAVWDFVALDRWVTPLIGLVAVGSGGYFLYKYWYYRPVCDVASPEEQARVQQRAARLVNRPLTLAVAVGLIGLALSVNIFEFVCSIGIPQAYTKILDLNNLSWLARQAYASIYLLGYMLDDIVVFGLALYSLDKIGLTQKYSKWTLLVGGILMLILGGLMLFKPEWLVF